MKREDIKGVPAGLATRWISKPVQSMDQRYGLSRRNIHVDHAAGYVSNPDVRKTLITWHQDTCKDFAHSFKSMVLSHATISRLSGFKSYFDYKSQSKMMSTKSVARFLKSLKSRVNLHMNAFMEGLFEQKVRDLNLNRTIEELRSALKYHGNTTRDFQKIHTDTQVNWGDVACRYILGVLALCLIVS
jgi:hypothetical protein